MNTAIEDSTWPKEDVRILDEFEALRSRVLRATKNILADFYSNNFLGNERVLEIGSGTGFLRRNWPDEFQGEWVQLDSQPTFLQEGKKRLQNGIYVSGSVYELPFPNESFKVVCGFGSFDVFMDLESAIKEAHRVLRKDGFFFHMLDLIPSTKPIERDFRIRHLPFQIKSWEDRNGISRLEEISYIPEEKLAEYNQASADRKSWRSKEDFSKAMELMDRKWSKYKRVIDEHEYFEDKLKRILTRYFDKDAVASGKLSSKFKGRRSEHQKDGKWRNFVYHQDSGIRYYELRLIDLAYNLLNLTSPSLASRVEPYCSEVSSLKYVVARKN